MATIAKTVGSFDKVLASCKMIGAQYQPNVPELKPAALAQLYDRAQQSLSAATAARIAYRMAVNTRQQSFKGIPKLAVRIVRMMASFPRAANPHLEEAVQVKNKFYQPKQSKKSDEQTPSQQTPSTQLSPSSEVATAKRASGRLSYDQQIETLSNLVELAEKTGNYNPVELDLSLQGLKQKLAELRLVSREVAMAHATYTKARLDRDAVLYGPNGIQEVSRAVKNYVLSAFGTFSDPSRQIGEV